MDLTGGTRVENEKFIQLFSVGYGTLLSVTRLTT
jgi:hypothetical protein